jgi:mRNA interferase MazF
VTEPLRRGGVLWVDLNPTRGREQRGTRPALIVASDEYLAHVPELAVVLPVTSVDRGWPHHVRLRGPDLRLDKPSFAMTEQPRTISRARVTGQAGIADAMTMTDVDVWLTDFLGLWA